MSILLIMAQPALYANTLLAARTYAWLRKDEFLTEISVLGSQLSIKSESCDACARTERQRYSASWHCEGILLVCLSIGLLLIPEPLSLHLFLNWRLWASVSSPMPSWLARIIRWKPASGWQAESIWKRWEVLNHILQKFWPPCIWRCLKKDNGLSVHRAVRFFFFFLSECAVFNVIRSIRWRKVVVNMQRNVLIL